MTWSFTRATISAVGVGLVCADALPGTIVPRATSVAKSTRWRFFIGCNTAYPTDNIVTGIFANQKNWLGRIPRPSQFDFSAFAAFTCRLLHRPSREQPARSKG